MKKESIITAFRKFVGQRSGLDPRNYGSRESLLDDLRPIQRAGRDARTMLTAVALSDGISAENILGAAGGDGRLTITERDGQPAVDYCAGQYFATEYRAAACRLLSQALWDNARRSYGCNTQAKIQTWARQQFGRGIASRWF